jgi:hypothetical protein
MKFTITGIIQEYIRVVAVLRPFHRFGCIEALGDVERQVVEALLFSVDAQLNHLRANGRQVLIHSISERKTEQRITRTRNPKIKSLARHEIIE